MNRHEQSLELPKILEKLADLTACEDAKEAALHIEPSGDFFTVSTRLAETDSAHILIAKFGAPSFGGLINVNNPLHRAQAGSTLSMRALLDIAATLRAIRAICVWREKSALIETALDDLFADLCPNKYLEEKIETAILSDGEMSDNASPELKRIRRQIKAQDARVREKLDAMLHSASYKDSLQEAIVTQRNGRFVVPVKSERRGEVQGMVHDTSGSGATVFIEPAFIVEANNEIKVLESKERDEIDRILTELSAEAGEFYDSIKRSYESAVALNVIFAKAQLAYSMRATKPILNTQGEIELKKARHPLLNPKTAVPIDISLGVEFDVLMITGPNTGGKTVSIKTLGLLTLMTLCGLFIPAAEGSRVAVFQKVLCDIGDEQSIEQSLSTFSAHMSNLVKIDEEAGQGALLLIDELGAGTDPVEGAALAIAIIEALKQKGAKVAATTHYSELKTYALHTARVQNASCAFDVETLRPTYQLLIGTPGRSNAFAISAHLGLRPEIIEAAKATISEENQRFEDVVDALETARAAMEKEKEKTLAMQVEMDALKTAGQEKIKAAEEKGEKIKARAELEAKQVVEQAKRAANALLLEIDRLKREQKREKNAAEMARKAKSAMKSHLNALDDLTAETIGLAQDENYKLPRPLEVGDNVLILNLGTKGTVLSLPDTKGNLEVRSGALKMKVKLEEIRLLSNTQVKKAEPRRFVPSQRREKTFQKTELSVDLRGKNAEEAILDLDMFIDSSVRSGLSEITIVHGKGTGVLRKAVAEHLRRHPNIRTFRLGVYGEGEDGVTIAELK